jgi:serine protease inhibitor
MQMTDPDIANIEKLLSANNDFGFRLLSHLVKPDIKENICISPPSIATALAMTLNGAEGTTHQAIAHTLGVEGMTLQEVNKASALARQMLQESDSEVLLVTADSLWARQGVQLAPEFVERLVEFYMAEVRNVNFTPDDLLAINGWVEEKTRKKIVELLNSTDIDEDTLLILLNAIYFKGIWSQQFDPALTREATFHRLDGSHKELPMMRQSGHYYCYEDQDLQAISLPYGSGNMSMLIFLPAAHSSLQAFHARLTPRNWERWISRFHQRAGEISLPRFRLEFETTLNTPLQAMGMEEAFHADANFSGLCSEKIFIGLVRHKTLLEVNEEGTEAAASTAVVMTRSAPLTMVVDRPFFVAIYDSTTGALLFMGYVVDPL